MPNIKTEKNGLSCNGNCSKITCGFVAFNSQGKVVACEDSREVTKTTAIAKGVNTPMVVSSIFVGNLDSIEWQK
jgi:hypothetical protein